MPHLGTLTASDAGEPTTVDAGFPLPLQNCAGSKSAYVAPEVIEFVILLAMPAIHGPKAITGNGQITVPKELLKEAGLRTGDQVYLRLDEKHRAAILILPGDLVEAALDRALQTGNGSPGRSE